MNNQQITLGMVYELLKQLEKNTVAQFETIDKRFESIDKRFENIDQRFESIDQRFESIDERFEKLEASMKEMRQELKDEIRDVKHDLRIDRQKLDKVYESRDQVTVSFTRVWAMASFFIAVTASTITFAVAKTL